MKIAAVKGYSRTITGVAAFEAAYGGKCDDFADQAREYVQTMRNKMCDYFAENIPEMKIIKPEACFVCWCDCHGLGFEDQGEMMKFLAEAGVLMSNGLEYDKELGPRLCAYRLWLPGDPADARPGEAGRRCEGPQKVRG